MRKIQDNNCKKERYRSIVYLIMTAVLWSLGGLLIKMVNWNPIAIAGMRSAIAAVFILIVIKKPKFTWSAPQIGAAVAYSATVILFVIANKMTTAANAILLQYTAPIYVALLSGWLLKEKVTKVDWITILAVMGGMILFFVDRVSTGNIVGNLTAIISGVAFAFLAVFMRMQKNGSPIESTLLGNILTAIIGLPFMFGPIPDGRSIGALLILGVVQLGLAYVLYSYAIKHVTALEAILIPVIEPVLNPLWVFLIIGEVPGVWSLIGGIVIIFCVTVRCLLVNLKNKKVEDEDISEKMDIL